MEKLNLFFSKIKELSFWQRLFAWKSVKALSYEAYQEFKEFEKRFKLEKENTDRIKNLNTEITAENNHLIQKIQDFEKDKPIRENKIESLEAKINDLNNELKMKNNKIAKYEASEEARKKTYEKNIENQNQLKESLEAIRLRLEKEREKEIEERFQNMKKTWVNHETDVQQYIKKICLNNVIEYVDKVPFKGNPDNTIKICDEFIIFDAKSPANNDLGNFPSYIINQTKSVSKYIKQQDVRKDVFLVIPSNTIHVIQQFSYNMSEYNVYIITKDSLEPIIQSLKRIENYEFAEQLSPEDRDKICRVIGKFTQSTKRRILIDQFFINFNLDLLRKCKSDIPKEILKQVIEIEQAEVINPPIDKRGKQIITKDLKDTQQNLDAKIEGMDIEDEIKIVEGN